MTKDLRRREISEIVKLVDLVAARRDNQIAKVHGIRVFLRGFENISEQVETVEGGEGLACGVYQRIPLDLKWEPCARTC